MSLQDRLDIDLIIVAAGSGERFGSRKAFLNVRGKTLIQRSIDFFGNGWNSVTIVSHPSDVSKLTESVNEKVQIISGGESRADSVKRGIMQGSASFVMVHDVARPFIPDDAINKLINAVKKGYKAATLVRAVSSSVCRISEKIENVSRDNLFEIQTPQIFERTLLLSLMGSDVTEETSLFLNAGHDVKMIHTNSPNPKITWKEDLDLINA